MSKHRSNSEQKCSDPATQEQRNNSRITMRLLLAVYLAYLIYQMIQGYLKEGDPILGIAAIFFAVVEGIIVISSLRRWMRDQQRINALWADAAETLDEMPDEEDRP